ncbi:MAG: Gfo/Idh/MocA family oxidoreductase [Chloroflexota bacterium]
MTIKVIQVGLGGMGNAWLAAVQASEDVEFAGFVEINDSIAAEQVKAYGLDGNRVYKTPGQALAAVQADGIINVTPPQFHREVSITAMEAGVPVLSEKPLAGTLEDSHAIVEKANETGVLHMVTQNYRYTALAQTVKSVLDSGAMGAVGSVNVHFAKGPHFGGFREEMPHPLIIDMSIHHFDMMRFFVNSNPARIFAHSWNPPWSWYQGDASATVHTTFENGVPVTYNGSWCARGMETTWNANWRFECELGILTIEDDAVYKQRYTGVEGRPGYRHVSNAKKEAVPMVSMVREGQDYLLHEFYQAVTSGSVPATTAQDNIHTIRFVFDIVKACDTGQIITTGELNR